MNSISLIIKEQRSAVMGFVALWIHMFHEHILVFSSISVICKIENFIKTIGCDGAEIFFFISGLGLTCSIKKVPLYSFMARGLIC